MSYVKLNLENAYKFVASEQIEALKSEVVEAANVLVSQSGAGNDFLGWLNLPLDYDKEEFDRILAAAEKIKAQADVLVVIGIGGSYLGAKSAIEMLKKYFGNKGVEIIFVGHQISGTYVSELIEYLKDLLAHPEKILNIIKDETSEVAKKYGDKRRTDIVADEVEFLSSKNDGVNGEVPAGAGEPVGDLQPIDDDNLPF